MGCAQHQEGKRAARADKRLIRFGEIRQPALKMSHPPKPSTNASLALSLTSNALVFASSRG